MSTKTAVTSAWTEIGTGLSRAIVQGDKTIQVYIGASAPAATDTGYTILAGLPIDLADISGLGGGVWVRANGAEAKVVHDSA